jgi:predicted nucleic acid-binding protein
MASKILTFVDASVLIYAASKPTAATLARRLRALQVLGDPDREFLSSEFLRLEILPIPVYFQRARELAFYQRFFAGVVTWADSAQLIGTAYDLACQFGLGAVDALHVAAAAAHGAELVCAERPTKPIYLAYQNVTSIY